MTAKFDIGALAVVRKNVPWTQPGTRYKEKEVLVLESITEGMQYRTCKVCLMLNPSIIFIVEERHLKKPRKYVPYKGK